MNFHLYPRSYFQLTSSSKQKISFLQTNLNGFTNHTYGQVPYAVVDGEHKMNSTVYVEILYLISRFLWIILPYKSFACVL